MTKYDCVTPEEYEAMEEYYSHPITPIEILGYAKNDIVKTQNRIKRMVIEGIIPRDMENKLKQAYSLLDEVQEYLYMV